MEELLIEIVVNGEKKRVAAGQTVAVLLKSLGVAPDRVAVEMNKALIRKRDWTATPIREGVHLEIVEFVGGG